MKLSYALFFIMLVMTTTSAVLSLILKNQFQLLGCNVSCILSIGLLFGSALYAFDDYCKDRRGHLGGFAQLTQAILSRL